MSPHLARIVTMNGRLGVMVIGNGVQVAYIVALVNALLQLLVSFGVSLTPEQESYIVTAVNLLMLIGARLVHQAARLRAATPPLEG